MLIVASFVRFKILGWFSDSDRRGIQGYERISWENYVESPSISSVLQVFPVVVLISES